MPGIHFHRVPESPSAFHGPLAASQVYGEGDPVFVDPASGTLIVCDSDATPILVGECTGFAGAAASGEESATRTGLAYGGGPGGASTSTARTYYEATSGTGLLLRTKNFYATGAAGTDEAKTGALRGLLRQISADNVADATAQWGVENTAGAHGTHLVAEIVDVLNDDMEQVLPGTTLTAGDGWIVFRIVAERV
jgi:hypothetical protein